MTTADPGRLSISEAAELIRKKQLSPVELTEACLDRIAAVDARVKAFITVTREDALGAAQQAAGTIARDNYKGLLHGIPLALKDLFDVAGVRTTAGSRILADFVASEDATATARLRAAGAVLLGKLNMHEFAFGITGVNPHYGGAFNPWDTNRMTGGSSSGSGAALAAGMTLGALGTDTGGSVRAPSALCGITGLKPTYSRVSRRGVVPLSWSLDHVGPMARSAADCAIILGAIAGHDPLDGSSASEPVPDYSRALAEPWPRGVRIGVPRELFFENGDQEVLEAVETAIDKFAQRLGASVQRISLPHIEEAPAAVTTIMVCEALTYHQRWLSEQPDAYGDDVRSRLELGALYPAVTYVQAQRLRSLVVEEWRERVFDRVDLLIAPTTPVPAPPLEENNLQTTLTLTRLTYPFNLAGVPVAAVPCGFTGSGLPIGMQIVGRWFEEATVLRAAHAYQQITDWHTRVPPL